MSEFGASNPKPESTSLFSRIMLIDEHVYAAPATNDLLAKIVSRGFGVFEPRGEISRCFSLGASSSSESEAPEEAPFSSLFSWSGLGRLRKEGKGAISTICMP